MLSANIKTLSFLTVIRSYIEFLSLKPSRDHKLNIDMKHEADECFKKRLITLQKFHWLYCSVHAMFFKKKDLSRLHIKKREDELRKHST